MSEKLEAKNWNFLKLQRYQVDNPDDKVHLGMKSWESVKLCGTLYDYDTPTEEFLKLYAGQFDCGEYQDSFTDIPSERRILKLRDEVHEVNKNFKLCPTIPRRVSHEMTLGENKFDLEEFLENMMLLEDHLGPCILRLPETFSPQYVELIIKFIRIWPKELPLSVHPTHGEWYKKTEGFFQLLKKIKHQNVSILLEDRMELPVDFGKLLNGDHFIVRFFGRPALNQDEQRLALWVYRLNEYKAFGIRNSYFFLYEQEEMSLGILRKVATSLGGNVKLPESFNVNSRQLGFGF